MYIYMHMNTNDENIWIAIEDKDVRQDKRRGLDVGRRHRLTRVRGPHATPRADDLAAPLLPGHPR